MGDYPNALHTWDDVTDEVDIISGAHMNSAHAEIIAIEQEQIELRSRFFAWRSSGWQTITTGAWRKILFDAVVYDEYGEFDQLTNNQFVANTEGVYFLGCNLTWNSWEAGKYIVIAYALNGTNAAEFSSTHAGTGGRSDSANFQIYMTAGQYVEVQVYTNLTAGKNIINGVTKTFFWGHKMT